MVAKSNPGIHGAYFHSPDSAGGFQEYRAMPMGVEQRDIGFQDKPFIVADANATSPKRDWLYVTWTRIGPEEEDSPDGTRQIFPIIFSQSEDGGVTWSAPVEISGEAEGVCPAECNLDHASHPVVGPDGTIYVSFANDNAMAGGSQILMVKCPADEDCTADGSVDGAGDRLRPHRGGARRTERLRVPVRVAVPSAELVPDVRSELRLELDRRRRPHLCRLGRLP